MRFDQVAFGCRLKETRKVRGLTQEQLAAVVNMSTVHLGNIELGKRGISIDLLLELSDALDVSMRFWKSLINFSSTKHTHDLCYLLHLQDQRNCIVYPCCCSNS